MAFSSGSVDRSEALIVTPSFMTDHSGFLRGLRPLLPPRHLVCFLSTFDPGIDTLSLFSGPLSEQKTSPAAPL